MSTALQMPVRTEAAEKVGRRRFRKQVLPLGKRIEHQGNTLDFNRDYLNGIVDAFKQRAFDQVPFVLADSKNLHNEDPERFRGEVKDLELTSSGLYAIVETSKRGAELLEENPRLGVSARIVEGLAQSDGRIFPRALRHVCATMDPVVTGLQDWEPLSIRSLSQSSNYEVVDLTTASLMTPPLTTDQIEKLNKLPDDQRQALEAILEGKAPESTEGKDGKETPADDKTQTTLRSKLKDFFGIKDDKVTDKDLTSAFESLLEDAKSNTTSDTSTNDSTTDRVPETANLSKEARDAIDLANSRAANAERGVVDLSVQLAESKWQLERKEYEDAGVPPALLDLAAPVMKVGAKTIDLSNGEKVDSQDLMRKMLDEAKGTIDLSVAGSSKDKEKHDEAKELAKDENWETSV